MYKWEEQVIAETNEQLRLLGYETLIKGEPASRILWPIGPGSTAQDIVMYTAAGLEDYLPGNDFFAMVGLDLSTPPWLPKNTRDCETLGSWLKKFGVQYTSTEFFASGPDFATEPPSLTPSFALLRTIAPHTPLLAYKTLQEFQGYASCVSMYLTHLEDQPIPMRFINNMGFMSSGYLPAGDTVDFLLSEPEYFSKAILGLTGKRK